MSLSWPDAGYSLWTNRSFKNPLLAAALVCIFGNVVYAVGYDVKALWVLLASRLLVGFGKPCFRLAMLEFKAPLLALLFLLFQLLKRQLC